MFRMNTTTLKNLGEDLNPETSDLAAKIWRSIVREGIPEIPHYKSWVISRPAKDVGGDFHMSSEGWVIVGDVSGKGIPAALLTGMFISALKLAVRSPNPGKALEHALFDELEQAEMFTSLIAVRLGADGWLNFLNIGHLPMLLSNSLGDVTEYRAKVPPIGIVRRKVYPVDNVLLEPKDIICLYSDGLIEAEDKTSEKQFGLDRLKNILFESTTGEQAFNNISQALENWRLTDDLTVIVLEYVPKNDWASERLDYR